MSRTAAQRIWRIARHLRRLLARPLRTLNMLGVKYVNPRLKERMLFRPYAIDLEPNTRCNLRCVFCQVPFSERSKLADMTLDDFKRILRSFPWLQIVKLQGMGEPFLSKEIFAMMEYCRKKGIDVVVNNNGTMLDAEKARRLISARPQRVSFSLDTPYRETYARLRGKDAFDKVVENIRLVVEQRKRQKAPTQVRIWSLLNKHNVGQMPELVRLAHELGVDRLTIQTFLGSYGNESLRECNASLRVDGTCPAEARSLDEAQRVARDLSFDLRIHRSNFYTREKPCSWPKSSLYVSVEGDVVPCCILANPELMSMGNLLGGRQRFAEIWNGKKYHSLRRRFNCNNIPSFCKDCYSDAHL